MKEKYHHGDLPTALIQAGIELINEEGAAALSLRKVAARCGVSHTAPYSHFKDKDDLLAAMKQHVTDGFAKALCAARDAVPATAKDAPALQGRVRAMGVAYVAFFLQNPAYYSFLFAQPDMRVNLNDLYDKGNYEPFEIFKQTAVTMLEAMGMPQKAMLPEVVGMWGLVHGIAGMAVMPSVRFDGDWETLVARAMAGMEKGEMP